MPRSAVRGRASKVAIPRLTWRMHDNELIGESNVVVAICIQPSRHVPSRSPEDECLRSEAMSLSQASLFLDGALKHAQDLRAFGYDVRLLIDDDVSRAMAKLASEFDHAVADVVRDPAYASWDRALKKAFGDRVTFVQTNTLVDLADTSFAPCLQVARETFVGSAFRHTKRLKAALHRHRRSAIPAPAVRAPAHPANTPDAVAVVPRLRECLRSVRRSCRRHGVDAYRIDRLLPRKEGGGRGAGGGRTPRSFDEGVLCVARRAARILSQPRWRKPQTARDVQLWRSAIDPMLDCSHMSPLIAVGMLGIRSLYAMVVEASPNSVPPLGSGPDQLLFREVWYAIAELDFRGEVDFFGRHSGWFKDAHEYTSYSSATEVKAGWSSSTITWRDLAASPSAALKTVWTWVDSSMDSAWIDANAAMKLLRREGWLHHLRRHLVADVLCRGQLRQHWWFGESWFRRTLVDHDATVNRANWLWLSATALSTRQSYRHYSPVDYVRRGPKARQKAFGRVSSAMCRR